MPGCGEEGNIETRWDFSSAYFLFFRIRFPQCVFVPLPPVLEPQLCAEWRPQPGAGGLQCGLQAWGLQHVSATWTRLVQNVPGEGEVEEGSIALFL